MSSVGRAILWITFVLIADSASAQSGGWHFGSWLDGPVAAFTPQPNDACQRAEVQRGIASALNARVGQAGGPSAPVTSAEGLATVPNGVIDGPTLTCRGTMRTTGGMIGPGEVVVRLAGNSSPNVILVQDATWESDADRERREAVERKERAKRIAEAPARETKMIDEMRASAKSDPDKTVHCGFNGSSFWTTNAVCFTLIEEARTVNAKVGRASRSDIIQECASDMARKLPGKDQPTYLNACEELLVALHL